MHQQEIKLKLLVLQLFTHTRLWLQKNLVKVENLKLQLLKAQELVIASGGVGSLQHLADGVSEGRADAVLAASIFHFGEHTVREAKEYMAARGIPVRLD